MKADCLGVLAKYWTPGRAKTRLGATMGAHAAALIHRQLLKTTLTRLNRIAAQRIVALDPVESIPELRGLAPLGWRFEGQTSGDLGRRISAFFDEEFARGAARVVLLGADSPHVPLSYIEEALAALHKCTVVIGPTDDGGYYLIGAAGQTPPIFDDMPWSSEGLFDATVKALQRGKQEYHVLPQWYDIDTFDQLRRLTAWLRDARESDRELGRLLDAILQIAPELA